MLAKVRPVREGGGMGRSWTVKVEVVPPQTNRDKPRAGKRGITLAGVSRLQKAGWEQKYKGEFTWWLDPVTRAPAQYERALRSLSSVEQNAGSR